ncbi:MAG: type II toxin-antitoxin system RelE/ParE family toxin [Hyphomicrobiales bacterium]|nr:MAG: type II toxin-antitoxin system RelE/ParE family toxin [Hyphomicrobiales bacterium]
MAGTRSGGCQGGARDRCEDRFRKARKKDQGQPVRRVRLTQEASDALAKQLDFLTQQGAHRAASSLNRRVHAFLENTLLAYPATGAFVRRRNVWECWIPRTRLVVWYRFDQNELLILTIWHGSQKRPSRT